MELVLASTAPLTAFVAAVFASTAVLVELVLASNADLTESSFVLAVSNLAFVEVNLSSTRETALTISALTQVSF